MNKNPEINMYALQVKVLTFFLVSFNQRKFVRGELLSSFMVSFQTSGKETTDEWVEYKAKMPSLPEFTVCQWFKMKRFNDDMSCLWSYCFIANKAFNTNMECIEFIVKPILSSGNTDIHLQSFLIDSALIGKVYEMKNRRIIEKYRVIL